MDLKAGWCQAGECPQIPGHGEWSWGAPSGSGEAWHNEGKYAISSEVL